MKQRNFLTQTLPLLLIYVTTLFFYACNQTDKPSDSGNEYPLNLTETEVECFVTSETESPLFQPVKLDYDKQPAANSFKIYIDESVTYQTMDGFGAAITGSTCYNLLKMTPENRLKILTEIFDPQKGMGYSFIRISIGCSDFSLDEFTWCDKQGMENFAIHPEDQEYLFPVLKEILAINPAIKIMGSPWTPPRWMKVNNLIDLKPFESWTSGQLNPAYYQDYAQYFVKWINTMQREGFPIYAVTIQNEPLNRGNSASLFMTWQEQRDFIKTELGPQFKEAGLKTKIVCYDHNYNYDSHKPDCVDQVGYPIHIFEDTEAAQYIDGSAWHAYGGEVSELDKVHAAFPDKSIYFTEMSIGIWGDGYTFKNDFMWNMREVCLGTINRYGRAVIMWNLMLDNEYGPYRPGGCDVCVGCIDIDKKDYATMRKNSHYYAMAHLAKVIRPNAIRIESKANQKEGLYHTAVKNEDGSIGMVIQNDTDQEERITILHGDRSISYTFPAKSVVSLRWNKTI